jgi:hypothetical protein
LAAQENRENNEEEKAAVENEKIEELVDKNMINLLRVCTMLKKPSAQDIEEREVFLGPTDRSKLLILDMDETLLNSRFHKLTGTEG